MYKEIEVIATLGFNTDGDGKPPTVLKQKMLVKCRQCRWYKEKGCYCNLFGTDKDPEGFCDEGLPSRMKEGNA